MADFRAPGPLEDPFLQPQLRASEILGHSDVRHCVVGDTVARILGHSLIVFQLYLAVADEQLEDAHSILLNHNFSDFPQDDFLYVDENATKDSPSGWPGYRLVSQRRHSGIILVPASLWHLDLRPASFAVNTFLLPDTNCRFPTRLFYLDALIDAIIERFSNPGFNRRITRYLDYQYSCLLTVLPKDLLALLPAEDQFFIDLFYKVLLPSARKKVCFQRQQIRMGLTSVEAAKQSIPRKDLQVAAAKAKYQKMDIQDENSNNLS